MMTFIIKSLWWIIPITVGCIYGYVTEKRDGFYQ